MVPRFVSSIRLHIVLLTALALFPALIFLVLAAGADRDEARERARADLLANVLLAARGLENAVVGTRSLLIALSHLPEVRATRPEECNALFARLRESCPMYLNVGAVLPDGRAFASGLPMRGTIDASDRGWFQRALRDSAFVVGDYQVGRVTGKPSVNFAVPAPAAGGGTAAVVFAAYDLAWMQRVVDEVGLRPGASLVILDQGARVLARQPAEPAWVGRPHDQGEVLLRRAGEGAATGKSTGSDGVERSWAVAPVRIDGGPGFSVALELPSVLVTRDADRRLARGLAGVVGAVVLALIGAWAYGVAFLVRPVEALVDASRSMAAGNLGARTAGSPAQGELGRIAQAFDEMAAAIEQRDRENRGAVEQLRILQEIDRAILVSRSAEEIAHAPLAALRRLLDADCASVALWGPAADQVRYAAVDAAEGFAHPSPGGVTLDDPADKAMFHRPDVFLADLEASPPTIPYLRVAHEHGLRTVLSAPLLADGRLLGRVSVSASRPRAFSEADSAVVRQVADALAVGLRQVELSDQARAHAQELEHRVAERTADLEAFAYTVSHDLRAPLRSIEGLGRALLEDFGHQLDITGRDFAERVVAAARRMDALIGDLLTYSRVGRGTVASVPVPLEAATDEAWASVGAEAAARGARLSVARPLPTVRGDRVFLLHLVANLLSNAAKFVPPGITPEVKVRAETLAGEKVRLWVEDNGIGIAREYHERIFKIFERLHGVEAYPGTGVGLAIVRRAAERMNGRVGFDSAPGCGSRFWVELPLARVEGTPVPPPAGK